MTIIDTKYAHEDEIEIADILLVIWQRKYFILAFTGIIVIATIIFLLFQKDIYRVSVNIEPIVLHHGSDGKNSYIETPENIKLLLDSKIFDNRMFEKLGGEVIISTDSLSFVTSVNNQVNQITVSLDHPFPDKAIDILKSVLFFLNQHYLPKIDSYIGEQKQNIKKIDDELAKKEKERRIALSDKHDQINTISETISFYFLNKNSIEKEMEQLDLKCNTIKSKIDTIEKQYETALAKQKDFPSLLSSNGIIPVEVLLFFASINNIESRLNSLQSFLYSSEVKKIEKQREVFKIEFNIRELKSKQQNIEKQFLIAQESSNIEMDALEKSKESVQSEMNRIKNHEVIHIIDPPAVLDSPARPKKKFILFIALTSGLLLSILSAFVLNYLRNYKNRRYGTDQA